MYASISQGHVPVVNKSGDTRVLGRIQQSVQGSGTYTGTVIQTSTTTTEEYRGLSQADAESLMVNTESSAGRDYLGSCKLTLGAGQGRFWTTFDYCWGTKISTTMSKMSDTNLYLVVRTTTVFNVHKSGDGTLEIL